MERNINYWFNVIFQSALLKASNGISKPYAGDYAREICFFSSQAQNYSPAYSSMLLPSSNKKIISIQRRMICFVRFPKNNSQHHLSSVKSWSQEQILFLLSTSFFFSILGVRNFPLVGRLSPWYRVKMFFFLKCKQQQQNRNKALFVLKQCWSYSLGFNKDWKKFSGSDVSFIFGLLVWSNQPFKRSMLWGQFNLQTMAACTGWPNYLLNNIKLQSHGFYFPLQDVSQLIFWTN